MQILDPSITAPQATMSHIYRVRRQAAAHLLLAGLLASIALVTMMTQGTGLTASAEGYHTMNSATLVVVLAALAAVWVTVDVVDCLRKESALLAGEYTAGR